MADSAAAAKHKRTKKRKAKLKVSDYKERPAKAPRKEWSKEDREEAEDAGEEKETGTDAEERETSGKIEEGRQWRNLELILSIQNKLLDDQKKVELVLHYVNSRSIEESVNEERVPETLSISRAITYISNWIQSLLISSEKKIRVVEDSNSEVFGFYLDCRCWEIFRFCLKESLRFHVSLSLSRDLLRVIRCVCRNVLHILKEVPVNQEESDFDNKSFLFYSVICDCISLIFSSHGGILNGNLDLWMDAIDSVLLLVIKIYDNSLGICDFGILVIQLSCSVLEPFCKFLRVHPCRKSGFRDFVDKLLEPLLHLLRLLHDQIDSRHPVWTEKLSKLVEEVTSYGLFHPVHIDEFPSLHSSEKYSSSTDGKLKDPKTTIKSYHRHLFDGLENIISQKKVLVLGGIGELFQLFVDCVKKQRRVSSNTDSSIIVGNKIINDRAKDLFRSSGSASEMTDYAVSIDSLTRKLIFDFFVKTTELLLLDMEAQLQFELPVGASFLDVLCALKSINKMLSTLVDEKLYLRTDDTIGGACINFLKVIYAMVMSYSAKANELWLSTCGLGGVVAGMDALILVAKEIVAAVSYFLEIEYEVIGDDLVSMWHMIISFLAMRHYFDIPELLLLTSETVDLACQLVNLYSELRQVNRPVFALCSGLRNLVFIHSSGESKYSGFLSSTSSLAYEKFAKSARWLLCLRKFRLTICDAIKTIPEGQASGFVQMLAMDISESLEWIKAGCSAEAEAKPEKVVCHRFSMQAELLGIVLAEIYAQVLDSLFVTAGNSYLMGVSIKNLIMVLCPHMCSLLALEWDGCDAFVFSVTGRTVKG
ncbi:hypothetical protein Nepgr_018222 [Nepenthes gracilis]|uniref:Uncharacterized protein n=1 Tax=Nepenthes gracilis TaxID=150966 RepID=A0AAD3XU40_NEPGR|nr:hypothetical protein Nepgr_018222 [Nepenthes gracilis]